MRNLINRLFNQDQDETSASDEAGKGAGQRKGEIKPMDAPSDVKNRKQQTPKPGSKQLEFDAADIPSSDSNNLDQPPQAESLDESIDIQNEIETTAVSVNSQRGGIDDTAVASLLESRDEVERSSPLLHAVQCCHIGNVRYRNEDSTFIFTAEAGGQEPLLPFGLYIVADGMGGHHAGDEASKKVSRIVGQHVLERIYLPLIKKSTQTPSLRQEPIQDVILEAIQQANMQIHNSEPGLESGTTLTAVLIFGRRLYITQVGDSRAYLLVDNQLKQITTDHSYVRRLVEAGDLTEDEAAVHPQRNMLYKAVGQGDSLDIDTFTQTLPKDGTLILCSDGLWGLVSDNDIKRVAMKGTSLWDKANQLVTHALEAGGDDNISAVLISFGF